MFNTRKSVCNETLERLNYRKHEVFKVTYFSMTYNLVLYFHALKELIQRSLAATSRSL